MELSEAILKRRSVRSYKDKPFSEDALKEILQSAIEAPSAGNLQSRRFFIVKDVEIRKALAKASYDQNFIIEAPVAIVVCVDFRIKKKYGSRGKELYSPMDCAASIQNLMLTACSLGLGTCWVGAFDEDEATEILNLPEHLRPVAIIPVGYANEKPDRRDRLDIKDVCEFL